MVGSGAADGFVVVVLSLVSLGCLAVERRPSSMINQSINQAAFKRGDQPSQSLGAGGC
jgi:hypothetical protein